MLLSRSGARPTEKADVRRRLLITLAHHQSFDLQTLRKGATRGPTGESSRLFLNKDAEAVL
jgi:hypothetical protein